MEGVFPASPVMGNLTSHVSGKEEAAIQIWVLVRNPVNLLGLCDRGMSLCTPKFSFVQI